MGKKKFISRRPELSFNEVYDQYDDCTAEDLFQAAADGDLTIYVLADNWNAESVYEIDTTKVLGDLSITFTGTPPPALPDSEDEEEFERQYQAWHNGKDKQDTTIGNVTFYGRNGTYRELYKYTRSGFQPISAKTIIDYRKGDVSSKIELDLNRILNLSDDTKERFFCPDPQVLLQDALNSGMLFVMKDDLTRLISNESIDPDNAKGKDDVSRKTLLNLVLGMAIDAYGYNHTAAKSPTPSELERNLALKGIEISNDTIKKALKEAALKYPPESTLGTIPRKPA